MPATLATHHSTDITSAAGVLLGVINVWTGLSFWHDKRQARLGRRRIPEATLLGLALIGGTPAAFAARRVLRHKTRKQPFSTGLWVIAILQAAVLVATMMMQRSGA
ncbi:MAG: hypothetical protein RIQ99_1569 [Pseudomonadota bacterium]|jgi:uncharacterized membrane protein YsdA (DUF1294 family)